MEVGMAFGPPTLLHIYDSSDLLIDITASVRRVFGRDQVHRIGVPGRFDLVDALDELVTKGVTFQRCLFETHGSSGSISFGHDALDGRVFRGWASRGYNRIFELHSRLYFNGCNVADDPWGWDFLDGAGKCFLSRGGGVSFAQTGVGRPIIFTGHVVHFGAKVCKSVWAPGGVLAGHVVE
jgi:hypothetical protein